MSGNKVFAISTYPGEVTLTGFTFIKDKLGESLFMDDDLLKCGDGTMLASDGLCEECFDYVVSSKCKEGISQAQIKEKIIDRSSLDNNLDVRNSKEL